MPELFGLDLAGIINDAMGADVLQGTLQKKVQIARDPARLTGGRNGGFATGVPFNGFFEERAESNKGGTLTRLQGKVISVLGGSLPAGTIPQSGDRLTLEGASYIISKTARDPAAALYECQVEAE